ncbi:MAG: phosphate uptake regulator PhoU [Nitrososphaerota archaeon]
MRFWRRSVQKTGGGSYIITLPKSWIEKQGISKKTPLLIKLNENGTLTISIEKPEEYKKKNEIIIFDSMSPGRDIIGSYLLGFDTIILQSSTMFSRENIIDIRKIVRSLAGAEITEESSNKIEVQILLNSEAVAPEKVLRREVVLVNSMILDCALALMSSNKNLIHSIIERDEEVNRQYFILVRVIRSTISDPEALKKLNLTPLKMMDLRLVAKIFEDTGDKIVEIAKEIIKILEEKINGEKFNELKDISLKITELLNKSLEAFITENHEEVIKILHEQELLLKRIYEFGKKVMSIEESSIVKESILKIISKFEGIINNILDLAELSAPISKNFIKKS